MIKDTEGQYLLLYLKEKGEKTCFLNNVELSEGI